MLTTSDYVEVGQCPPNAMPLAVRRLVMIKNSHSVLYCVQSMYFDRPRHASLTSSNMVGKLSIAKALKALESASTAS
jgi:hypothetical protein